MEPGIGIERNAGKTFIQLSDNGRKHFLGCIYFGLD